MAKQLTTFMPGAFTATTTLTYKEHRYMGAWGEDMNGCGNASGDYGHPIHFLDRDDTPCTESNNRHVMRRTVDRSYGTEVFAMTASGAGGGACCCMSSGTGRGGITWKFSPRWSDNCADSDTMRMCIPMSSGCCHPSCQGCCSEPYTFCVGGGTGVIDGNHPYTGSGNSGQPGVFCASFLSGCGAASECNYHFQPCCNYGALNTGGGFNNPCCCTPDTGRVSCYTTCKALDELPFAACDRGYDCFRCVYRQGGNFESGSCINRESSGICGIVMMGGTSIAKTQIFRQGVVSAHSTTRCEMAQGGWTQKCDRACLYGVNPQKSGYWTAGMALPTAHVCGGPCCCGSQAAGGLVRIIYDDGNPNP